MEDFLELCNRRQSCRNFSKKSIEHDKLVKCAEAGRLAPSACNSQPWSFIVIETPEIVRKVAECGQYLNSNQFLSNAQAFIIILEEYAVLKPQIASLVDSQSFAKGDLGAATVHVCLEAEMQRLGTCIIGMYDRVKLGELLNIPRDKHFGAFIAVGYPEEDKIRPKIRKSPEEVIRFV